MTEEGQGGNYWIIAGGDVGLFASTQVPPAERDIWNPPFQQLMASLQITRDDELVMRKVANEVLARLKEKHPEQEFEFEGNTIRGKGQVEIALPYRADLTQQHGFIHAGIVATILDSACGYAAFSLMPADVAVLTVEYKINLLRPAKGDRLVARARVVRALSIGLGPSTFIGRQLPVKPSLSMPHRR